jgi:hypothetical protein
MLTALREKEQRSTSHFPASHTAQEVSAFCASSRFPTITTEFCYVGLPVSNQQADRRLRLVRPVCVAIYRTNNLLCRRTLRLLTKPTYSPSSAQYFECICWERCALLQCISLLCTGSKCVSSTLRFCRSFLDHRSPRNTFNALSHSPSWQRYSHCSFPNFFVT